jgi:hypothetical protein
MNKASSLFVLILLGSLVADAVAQTNPPRGNQQGGQQSGQGQGQGQGSYNPNVPVGQQGGQHGQGQHGQGQHGQGQHGQGQQQPQYPSQGSYDPYPQYPSQGSYDPYPQYPSQGSYDPYPQYPSQGGSYSQTRIITQQLLQSLRSYETLRLSDVLRLSMNESRDLEVVSISLTAQSLRGQTTVDILSRGRSVVVPQLLRRQLSQVQLQLPSLSRLDDLEITASDEIIIESIQVEVRSVIPQVIRPFAGQMIRLQLSQSVRNGEIGLKQLVKQQLGLSLDGVSLQGITVVAQSIRGVGSVQLEMNNMPASNIKSVSNVSRAVPLLLNSSLPVNGNLRLVVRGEVLIREISIRVGQVRAW